MLHRTAGQLFFMLHRTAGQLFVMLHRTAGLLSELRSGTEWRVLRSHGTVFAVQRWALAVYIGVRLFVTKKNYCLQKCTSFVNILGAP